MDVGNLPIYSGHNQRSRSSIEPKTENKWEQIGDYEGESSASTTNGNNKEENDDDFIEEKDSKPTKVNCKDKKESDDAASIASEIAKKESLKHGTD